MLQIRLNLREIFAIVICFAGTIMFLSCDKEDKEPRKDHLTYDEGVVINGIKWATRNVSAVGKFAAKPEDAGMFYQWNRKVAWAAIGDVSDWDTTIPEGITWEKTNDPSPTGWRVPTTWEIFQLCNREKVTNEWAIVNNVKGRKFTDIATGNSIFLPAASCRGYVEGTLYPFGWDGRYWSSTQSNDKSAFYLHFDSEVAYSASSHCRYGLTVRCVSE
ncbi:MAG: hypothetical protein LBI82_11370 [Dysgonamonadaceae bacterium]|jgi:uncharacterized protein (TIGR02145 family)|nr:hypothetical protein [Dysgonamonadaceae bacterium]